MKRRIVQTAHAVIRDISDHLLIAHALGNIEDSGEGPGIVSALRTKPHILDNCLVSVGDAERSIQSCNLSEVDIEISSILSC